VKTIEEFLTLLRDDMGLPVTENDLGLSLDQVAGWDSVHLLSLLTFVERRTGRTLPLADVLEATSLKEIHVLAARDE
jgi:acyl carrier protein